MLTGGHSWLIQWLVLIAAIPVNLYPFFYSFRPWETTSQGRALMIKSLGNLILIDMIVAFQWFGEYRGHEAMRTTGMVLFIIGICYLFWSLLTSPGAKNYPPFQWRPPGKEDTMTIDDGGHLPEHIPEHREAMHARRNFRADPKRPYKAIGGAIVTFLGLLIAQIQASPHPLNTVGDWATVLLPTVVAFLTVYGITNPKIPVKLEE